MVGSIEAAKMEASSGRSGFWKGSKVMEAPDYWDTCHSPEGQILTTSDAPRSSACRYLRKRNRETKVGERFFSALISS